MRERGSDGFDADDPSSIAGYITRRAPYAQCGTHSPSSNCRIILQNDLLVVDGVSHFIKWWFETESRDHAQLVAAVVDVVRTTRFRHCQVPSSRIATIQHFNEASSCRERLGASFLTEENKICITEVDRMLFL